MKNNIYFNEIRKLYHIKGNCGFSEAKIQEACVQFGELPLVLKEYYRQLGKVDGLNHAQNHLCEPDHLIQVPDYVIFYKENQYVVQWALKKDELNQDNPPVYCAWDEKSFSMESKTLTEFLTGMAYFQAVFALPYCSDEIYQVTEKQAERIRQNYQKKNCELKQWLSITFYGNEEDEIVYLGENNDYDLIYSSSNKKHYERLNAFMETIEPTPY